LYIVRYNITIYLTLLLYSSKFTIVSWYYLLN